MPRVCLLRAALIHHQLLPLAAGASRNADTLKRLQETERALKETQQAAYVDLDISSAEKEKGNEAFKEQRWVVHGSNCLSSISTAASSGHCEVKLSRNDLNAALLLLAVRCTPC